MNLSKPQNQHQRPLRATPEVFGKGNEISFMISFPRKTSHRPSPYSGRFSVLTMGSTSIDTPLSFSDAFLDLVNGSSYVEAIENSEEPIFIAS